MKFPSMKESPSKALTIETLDGGVNLRDSVSAITDNQLTGCNNMWFKNGMLRTRPGLYSNKNLIVKNYTRPNFNDVSLNVSDCKVFMNNNYYQIGYVLEDDLHAQVDLHVYLISKNDNLISTGYIPFNRTTSDLFYRPDKVLFFSSAATKGAGIYACITLYDYPTNDFYCKIYELNSEYNNWIWLMPGDCYTPTLLLNGRGTLYEKALLTGQANTAPVLNPESQNLLTPNFLSYFTSDGFSSCFNLPLSNLSKAFVKCRVHRTPEDYTDWFITENSNSDTKTFFGTPITLNCNREKGVIYFTSEREDYPIPLMLLSNSNNISIETRKDIPDGFSRVLSSNGCTLYNSRLLFYGNRVNPNELILSRIDNPLYFPQNLVSTIGQTQSKIEKIAVQNERIVALKQNEIFYVTLTAGNAYYSYNYTNQSGIEKIKDDVISVKLIHSSIGCDCPDTVRLCGNRLVWLNSSGSIYTLITASGNDENNVYEISMLIENFLKKFPRNKLKKSFAVDFDGYYLIIIENKAVIMDFSVKGFRYSSSLSGLRNSDKTISWFCWTFPEDIYISGGISDESEIRLCCTKSGDNTVFYFAKLNGNSDFLFTESNNEVKTIIRNISSSFTTKLFDFGHIEKLKSINDVFITASGINDITVSYVTPSQFYSEKIMLNLNEVQFEEDEVKTTRLMPALRNIKRIGMTVNSDNSFSFGGISINYKEKK